MSDVEDDDVNYLHRESYSPYAFAIIAVCVCLCLIFYFGSRPPITCIDGVIHEEISKDVFVKSVPERQCRNRKDAEGVEE